MKNLMELLLLGSGSRPFKFSQCLLGIVYFHWFIILKNNLGKNTNIRTLKVKKTVHSLLGK